MKRPTLISALLAMALAGCQPSVSPPTGEALSTEAYIRSVALLQADSHSLDPIVRAQCVESLQSSPDPRAEQVIQQRLNDEEWVVRFAAAMASGKRKYGPVAATLESMAAADPSGSVRAASIYALRRMDRASHMSALAALLGAPDPQTRANTALVLGLLGDDSAIPLLESRREEPDIRVKFELTAALARLGEVEAQKVIVSWAVHKFLDDQWNAMSVCGDMPPAMGVSPLLLGLEPSPKLPAQLPQLTADQVTAMTTRRQLVAARSLAKLHNSAGVRVAIDNLRNPQPELRGLALLALGEMMTPLQVQGIVPYLQDSDEGVRRTAAAAIINIFTDHGNAPVGPQVGVVPPPPSAAAPLPPIPPPAPANTPPMYPPLPDTPVPRPDPAMR